MKTRIVKTRAEGFGKYRQFALTLPKDIAKKLRVRRHTKFKVVKSGNKIIYEKVGWDGSQNKKS